MRAVRGRMRRDVLLYGAAIFMAGCSAFEGTFSSDGYTVLRIQGSVSETRTPVPLTGSTIPCDAVEPAVSVHYGATRVDVSRSRRDPGKFRVLVLNDVGGSRGATSQCGDLPRVSSSTNGSLLWSRSWGNATVRLAIMRDRDSLVVNGARLVQGEKLHVEVSGADAQGTYQGGLDATDLGVWTTARSVDIPTTEANGTVYWWE